MANIIKNFPFTSLLILIKGLGLGITIGIVLGFAGFIIDFLRKKPVVLPERTLKN